MSNKSVKFSYSLLSCVVLLSNCVQSRSINFHDICDGSENQKIYVEPKEKSVTVTGYGSVEYKQKKGHKIDFYQQCRVELVSCPACVIFVNFTFLNLTQNRAQNCVNNASLNSCGCNYIQIYEPSYEKVSEQQFCGYYTTNNSNELSYRSKTRAVVIAFSIKQFHQQGFTLQYASERNRHIIQEVFDMNNTDSKPQIISTPFFPLPYLKDLNIEFVISCKIGRNCKIHIIFTDFLIAKMSVIEFLDSNGQRLGLVTGLSFRPPIIISSGSTIIVRFYANGATNTGFKAMVTFLMADTNEHFLSTKPNTDCGGLVDDLGGTISITNRATNSVQSFDCVWVIQSARQFLHFYTHSYLKVVAFSNFAGSTEMSIHRGLTSASVAEEILLYPFPHLVQPIAKQHILPILQGIYIKFKGALHAESKLAIAYTAFSYNACISATDFSCKNEHCIPIYLQCDGFDHCGDNSDEFESCPKSEDKKGPIWFASHLFSKTDQYSSEPYTAAIMFIICFFGLTLLILALIFLISRTNGQGRYQREMHNNLQIISDLLEQETASIQEEVIVDDPPPVYEPPPSYDEADKNILDSQRRSRRKLSSPNELLIKSRHLKRGYVCSETCRFCRPQLKIAELQYAQIKLDADSSSASGTSQDGNDHCTELPLPANSNITRVLAIKLQSEIQLGGHAE